MSREEHLGKERIPVQTDYGTSNIGVGGIVSSQEIIKLFLAIGPPV
ncbi:MAG: hypothetical protein R6U93_04610 [Dehalococcoidia bacterium]